MAGTRLPDDRYGDREFDRQLAPTGLARLFLHAAALTFTHPNTGESLRMEAPLDKALKHCLSQLRQQKSLTAWHQPSGLMPACLTGHSARSAVSQSGYWDRAPPAVRTDKSPVPHF